MAKGNKYPQYKQLDVPSTEKSVLEYWKQNKIFEQSIANRADGKSFVFYEGPPSANGMPGIHHVISRSIKDVFCRYKTLQGYKVERKAGWDTHGLPIELQVEKKLGITKEDIGTKISVEEYNAAWQGADWNLAERYTDMLKTVFVGLFFLVPLPSGLFISAFAMLTTYLVDKYSLFRLWQRNPSIDHSLGMISRYFLVVIVFTHLAISRVYFANW